MFSRFQSRINLHLCDYIMYATPMENWRFKDLRETAEDTTGLYIICGDLNSHNKLWGSGKKL